MAMIRWEKIKYLDVVLKLFVLLLEKDAIDWFINMLDSNFSRLNQLESTFFERWEENNDTIFCQFP